LHMNHHWASMVQPWVKVPGEKPYYWNLETEETSWLPPAGTDVAWVVQKTEAGVMYYWNKKTDESTWKSPFGARRGPPNRSAERSSVHVDTQSQGLAYGDTQEPLAGWPHMGVQQVTAHATASVGKIEPGPMMVVHALKQSNPNGHMVSFVDGRMMMKLPACMGGATLVPMQGSSAQLQALAAGGPRETVEAADNLTSLFAVKGGPAAGSWSGGRLAQSGFWDINRLQELNCRFVDATGYKKKMPLNTTSLQMEAIKTLDGISASFLPGCLSDDLPFVCCAEEFASYEHSSVAAATKRLRYMRSRGLVAASLRVATRMLSYSWMPGVLACNWKPYLSPKTLSVFREKVGYPAIAPEVEARRWEAPGAPRPPPPTGREAKVVAARATVQSLLAFVRPTVLDILGGEAIEDDTPLLHAGVNPIISLAIPDTLEAMAPELFSILPEHVHDLSVGFEPPPPSAEAALAKAEGKAAGESEKGCRATATRIRSAASSFYTLMGSTAADYTTMALNIPQAQGRGPGLSAQPFTAALSP